MGKLLSSIKKDAIKGRTKIQTSDAQKLETILNKLFFLEKDIKEEVRFVKSVMTRGADSQERIGLHASALIKGEKDFCLRQQVLSLIYRQLQGEQIPVGLKRIFEEGNAIHEKWQRLLIRGGFCTADDLDVTQMNKKYRISFTPDVICEIPEFHDGKMVGEIKSVNTFQFHKGFVLSEDKNTQDIKVEIYDFDESIVQPFVDRAEQIKKAYIRVQKENKMVKRPKDATSPECKRCEQCALRNACWNINGGGVKIEGN